MYHPAGEIVLAKPTAPALRKSYPAANWLTKPQQVILRDEAPGEGTLDVVNVETMDGEEQSIYDFNIVEDVSEQDALLASGAEA